MAKIKLKNIKIYAYHGCLLEERKIGSDYLVNLAVYFKMSSSSKSDNVKDTIDYLSLQKIVKEEMAYPSNLLETVVQRIIDSVLKINPSVLKVAVEVEKTNPPINGNLTGVSVKKKVKR